MKKNAKTTKKALVMSVLSLLLCMSMLVGTTFAWFTDSVESGMNMIAAGNLDVELEYMDADGNWQTVTRETNVFAADTLWEPGHTEVVYLKVANRGTLALDYKLGVCIVEETTSTSVTEQPLKLSEFIMMGAVDDVTTRYATREDARDDLQEIKPLTEAYAKEGTLYSVSDAAQTQPTEEYVALVVYMPEDVDNAANYKTGCPVPTITLGISLLATQETYEKDSFNHKYDEIAETTAAPVPCHKELIDVTVYDVFDANIPQTDVSVEMDVYDFIAENFSSVYPVEEYADWICDYYVSTDSPVDDGLILIGNYGGFGWLGFWVPANEEAYEPIGLLGVVGNKLPYSEICSDVQYFRCGLVDYYGNNDGVKVTVELRMTSPDETQTITAAKIDVVLGQ